MKDETVISLKIIEKKFGLRRIFSDASFEIKKGALTAVTGLSGSGKTTLLKMSSGLDSNWLGEFYIGNNKIDSNKRFGIVRKISSFVFQTIDLLDYLTVEENILLPFHYQLKEYIEEDFLSLLERLRLSDKKRQISSTLSLGEKQRVAIARAFITKPQIIFADEPTGSLDDVNTKEVMSILKALCKERKTALFMTTHRESLLPLFDEVYRIHDEKIEKIAV